MSYYDYGVYKPVDIFGTVKVPKKEKEMIDTKKPYSVAGDWSGKTYETIEEAQDAGKKLSKQLEGDVAIKKIVSVVKFPIPDYEVVAVD